MMTDRSFGGLLVLSGHHDVSVAWRKHLVEDSPYMYGDLQSGEVHMRPGVADTVTAIADIAQSMTIKPYAFVCGGDPHQTAHIPTRSTSICAWAHGDATVKDQAIRHLLNINRDGPVQANYGELVHRRVFSSIPGSYACVLGYFSKHSRLLLCARDRMLFLWLVYLNGVYSLVWSTNPLHIEQSVPYLPTHLRHELFSYPIALFNSTVALQPTYLVSKFARHLREAPSPANRLTVIGYLASYIQRQQNYFHHAHRQQDSIGDHQEGRLSGGDGHDPDGSEQ